MHAQSSNQRQNHRFHVADIGYRATIAVGNDVVDCLVLDFSAAGIQVEIPVSLTIPDDGSLIYGGQAYRYLVKHERFFDQSRRLGLELTAAPDNELSCSDQPSAAELDPSQSVSSPGVFTIRGQDLTFWVVGLIGVFVVWGFLLFIAPTIVDRHELDTFWAKMAKAKDVLTVGRNKPDHRSLLSPRKNLIPEQPGEKLYSQVVSSAVTSNNAAVRRVGKCLEQADYEAALRACDKALSDEEPTACVLQLRSIALRQLARSAEAIIDLRQALELDDNSPQLYADLAQALFDSGRFDEGLLQIALGMELTEGEMREQFAQLLERACKSEAEIRQRSREEPVAESS